MAFTVEIKGERARGEHVIGGVRFRDGIAKHVALTANKRVYFEAIGAQITSERAKPKKQNDTPADTAETPETKD